LPLNEDVLDFLNREHRRGRPLCLASGSDSKFVNAIAQRLGIFDRVFASNGAVNLTASAKARALCQEFGAGGFDYIGNDRADMPVWNKAHTVYVANASQRFRGAVFAQFAGAQSIGSSNVRIGTYLRAIRIHQWLKNLLVFVPAFAAHSFGMAELLQLLFTFVAFGLCSSSTYLLNDLFDLTNDRRHARKRTRPLASGQISPLSAIGLIGAFLVTSFAIAYAQSPYLLLVLAGYTAATTTYSAWLKRKITIDLVTLAGLYNLRLVAGAVVATVPLSTWFVAFSVFLFFSLATIKRCAELVALPENSKNQVSGRGYGPRDLPMLEAMAAASGYVAIMVFTLYINSPAVVQLYSSPERLWAICIVLLCWISRILVLTHRGQMHDDPIVFAARDWQSILSALLAAGIVLISI
jgi:4-hydroxybenzoate polyprenyltransferase